MYGSIDPGRDDIGARAREYRGRNGGTPTKEAAMTLRMAVYYRPPDDPAVFEKRYVEGHLPLVRAYDNIKSLSLNKVSRALVGEFPYAYVFTGTWASKDDWKADMASDKAKRAAEDAASFATQGFDVVVFEDITP
jgi:uncharacterized protein (TIGR02118 family)